MKSLTSPLARRVVRATLSRVDLTRHLQGSPYSVTFPASQYLSLVRPGGMAYEPEIQARFRELVRPGDRVLDVGANIGLHTLLLAHLVGPDGAVTAFEPDPQSSSYLLRNLMRNGLRDVTVYSTALSSGSGHAPLFIDSMTARTTSLMSGHIAPSDVETRMPYIVMTAALDDLDVGEIDFAKVDIEGAEVAFLRGAAATLGKALPPLLIEVREENSFEVYDMLRDIGYRNIVDASTGEPAVRAYFGNLIAHG